jgi:hypothetical protein
MQYWHPTPSSRTVSVGSWLAPEELESWTEDVTGDFMFLLVLDVENTELR